MEVVGFCLLSALMKKIKDSISEVKVLSWNRVVCLLTRINSALIQESMAQHVTIIKLINIGHSMKMERWLMIHLVYVLMSTSKKDLERFGLILARICLIRCGRPIARKITVITSTSKTRITAWMQEMYPNKLILKLVPLPSHKSLNLLTMIGSLQLLIGSKGLAIQVVVWLSN